MKTKAISEPGECVSVSAPLHFFNDKKIRDLMTGIDGTQAYGLNPDDYHRRALKELLGRPYWTAEVLEDKSVTFREDVYGRDAPVLRALGGTLASSPKPRPASTASVAAKPAPAAEKPAPAAGKLATGGWVVQVASVTNPVGAQRLVDELAEQGFAAVTTRSEVDGKSYHRVRLGPLANRQEAAAMVESLRTKTGYTGQALRR